ncbi:hypothetical protein MBAV_002446 [Candidatus Magnetobacterium bavaricum]|uniref:Uncharacterized protein n=1 Tax=Candidatus Magnetobacterium bavaricum TaxID=29290 RepID=A0A0F3GXF5_9BACT|nr:hypothetical protein MBAV_002446 [Candidatus Magnetobacterium bavaricum]
MVEAKPLTKEDLIEALRPVIERLDLLEKHLKHQAFIEETLSILENPDYLECDSAEEAMDVIRNFKE